LERTYGIMVSEDDFSDAGTIEYKPAFFDGKETDFTEIAQASAIAQRLLIKTASERDNSRKN